MYIEFKDLMKKRNIALITIFILIIGSGYLFINNKENTQRVKSVVYTDKMIYAELSGDFPLGDSRQPTYKSLRPFDLVS